MKKNVVVVMMTVVLFIFSPFVFADMSKEKILEATSKMSDREILLLISDIIAARSSAKTVEQAQQTEFDVVLVGHSGKSKIPIIKVIKEITGLGLKEVKTIVESPNPTVIKRGSSKKEAEAIKAKLEEVGGKVDLK